ncbi:hypothetical protein EV401DRAFT_1977998, partial [Pisolithus croceorrhizus]
IFPLPLFLYCSTGPLVSSFFFHPLRSAILPTPLDGLGKTSKLQIIIYVQIPSLCEGEALCPRAGDGEALHLHHLLILGCLHRLGRSVRL